MNFYEIEKPYYAVVRANDDVDATKKYIEIVAGEENEFDEIHQEMNFMERDKISKMLEKSIRSSAQEWFDEDLIDEQVRRYLEDKTSEVILVDVSLI